MLHLGADELTSALEGIQPLDVLAEEPAVRTARSTNIAEDRDGRLSPWPGVALGEPELVLLEDYRSGISCVLPAAGLRGCRAAVLTRVAARQLLNPAAGRAAVLGCGAATDLQLVTIARHLPSIREVAVCPVETEHACPIEQRALDEIDLAEVRLTVTADAAAAVAEADLVVVACTAASWPAGVRPRPGAVVVNATDQDLPDELVDAADELYVDDAELAGEDRRATRRGADADLNQVRAGRHPGRTAAEHVVLVELLTADRLDVELARMLYRAAVERGLGNQRLD
jgi:ornithine cyclodeaminase/alanine dehydrogenase-like protein (mu-crystallin family)